MAAPEPTNVANAAMPSDVDFYKHKAESVARQLKAMDRFLTKEELAELDEAELQARLEQIERMNADFDAAQTSLERLDFLQLAHDARLDFSNVYVKVRSRLSRELMAARTVNVANSTARHTLEGNSYNSIV